MSAEYLDHIVIGQKQGQAYGLASICSSHPFVLKAAMRRSQRNGSYLLVESTCNQVNQFGGYSGLTPADFAAYVLGIARKVGLPPGRLLLGGDHLGPSVWQEEPAEAAMNKAVQLVQAYAQEGFVKIHLDASMRLRDDSLSQPLDLELSASRTARLAVSVEEVYAKRPDLPAPRYVIGTEVPIPGGARQHEASLTVTSPTDARRTVEATRAAFLRAGLAGAWERVMALVVQPGVEFGDDFVIDYRPEEAASLARWIESQPALVFEAHSTDYQLKTALEQLVRDHFAILKVGPALTYAFREAVFALADIEAELIQVPDRSDLRARLDESMRRNPRHWSSHYHGTEREQALARGYSFSDRSRYYWPEASVQAALRKLIANLSVRPIPLTLLSQFRPEQCQRIREGRLENTPEYILLDSIEVVLDTYSQEPVHG